MCGFHEVEHDLDGFYHYPKTDTSPERWICKAKEADRQRMKNEKKKAEAAKTRKSASKSATSKRTTARKTTRAKIAA